MKQYFYRLLHKYLTLYVQPGDALLEISPHSDLLIRRFQANRTAVLTGANSAQFAPLETLTALQQIKSWRPDYILLNGNIHYERDIQRFLEQLHPFCEPTTRIIILYYSSLWRPFIRVADRLKLRQHTPEQNWIAHSDVDNLLLLAGFEPVRRDQRILMPVRIPFVSDFINRYCAPLPFFRLFTMVNMLVARPAGHSLPSSEPSVSIIVPARNEAGTIAQLIERLPKMGPDDEVIFVEGHSTDNTWETIQQIAQQPTPNLRVKISKQDGQGKGDAVRKGFALASQEILMILDADLTVAPEELPKFYHALVSGKGEFINGSRLVYPMEEHAMQFWNIVGNKFFATAFSFVLGQRVKDTLCGTKALRRSHYLKIAAQRSYFGDFDPFGDFDLLFGASRLALKMVEIPVAYRTRTYGATNIQRWRHGLMLLRMLLLATRKIKCI